jgi:hypothetical protein
VLTARVAATARSPEALSHTSAVPYCPDVEQIQRHLVHCLEMHHGNRSTAGVQPDEAVLPLRKVAELTAKERRAIRGAFRPTTTGADLCIPGSGMSGSGPTAPDALPHPIREDP